MQPPLQPLPADLMPDPSLTRQAADAQVRAPVEQPDGPSPAFLKAVDRWKRQLLDLSGRNRAIYFKASRTSTIEITDTAGDLWVRLSDGDAVDLTAAGRMPPDAKPEAGESRRKALRALGERARVADEEQGVQILHVAFGWLDWFDERKREMARSPLVLMPVSLSGGSIRAIDDDPPELNPALAEILRVDHRILMPELSPSPDEQATALASFIEAVTPLVAGRDGWLVTPDAPALDIFSFRKVALVREIERSISRLWKHPLVRAFSGDSSLLGEVPPLPAYPELDLQLPAGSIRAVLPADASQLRAVAAGASGASMVIQGPPGTGKSQTITNLIAEFLAEQKTVLFVAEKAVARDVVLENLKKAGLEAAALHLKADAGHARGSSSGRADVLEELRKAYEQGPLSYRLDADIVDEIRRLREELNSLAASVHQPVGAEGWTTPFQAIGEALVAGSPQVTAPVPPLASSPKRYLSEAIEAVQQVEDLGAGILALFNSPLSALSSVPADPAGVAALRQALDVAAALSSTISPLLQPLLGPADPPAPGWSLTQLGPLDAEVQDLCTYQRLSGSLLRWLRPAFYRVRGAAALATAAGRSIDPAALANAPALSAAISAGGSAAATLKVSFASDPTGMTVAEVSAQATGVLNLFARLPEYARLLDRLRGLEPVGLRALVEAKLRTGTSALPETARAALWGQWATEAVESIPTQDSDARGRLVARFRAADQRLAQHATMEALNGSASRRPDPNQYVPPESSLGRLRRATNLKRRPPLRRVLAQSPDQVLRLKPCMLMSPLAVAQYLGSEEGSGYEFDICILDEASMVPTADMVVAMSMAKQLIVCGDSKQMPPTTFFDRLVVEDTDEPDDDDATFESLLDEAVTILPPQSLRWHYRSRDESLIAFSNAHFYGGALVTFPVPAASQDAGVVFEFVADGVYGRGGSRANPPEAEAVVRVLTAELRAHPQREVGITAMSTAQQAEIADAVERASLTNAAIKSWLDAGNRPKNLETIQGDECDTMIISLGYGRDAAGRMILNFGPLAKEGGERRLNVAVTRARWKTVLVSSIKAADIPPERTQAAGALALHDYLDYAERGAIALAGDIRVASSAETESPFETAVLRALTGRGLRCQPQVGVGAHRIDIGIRHPQKDGLFVLGVECDGASYHSAPCARDRDIARQDVLERMGWRFHRVWSANWFRDPKAEADRVVAAYERALAETNASGGAPVQPPLVAATPVVAATPLVASEPENVTRQPDPRLGPWRDRTSLRSNLDLAIQPPLLIANNIVQILEECGPLSQDDLMRFLRLGYGAARMGPRMQQAAANGLDTAIRRSMVALRSGFIWPATLEPHQVLLRRPPAGQTRDAAGVPPEEGALALLITIEHAGGIDPAEAARVIKEQLTLPQVNERAKNLAAAAIQAGIGLGWFVEDEKGWLELPGG